MTLNDFVGSRFFSATLLLAGFVVGVGVVYSETHNSENDTEGAAGSCGPKARLVETDKSLAKWSSTGQLDKALVREAVDGALPADGLYRTALAAAGIFGTPSPKDPSTGIISKGDFCGWWTGLNKLDCFSAKNDPAWAKYVTQYAPATESFLGKCDGSSGALDHVEVKGPVGSRTVKFYLNIPSVKYRVNLDKTSRNYTLKGNAVGLDGDGNNKFYVITYRVVSNDKLTTKDLVSGLLKGCFGCNYGGELQTQMGGFLNAFIASPEGYSMVNIERPAKDSGKVTVSESGGLPVAGQFEQGTLLRKSGQGAISIFNLSTPLGHALRGYSN